MFIEPFVFNSSPFISFLLLCIMKNCSNCQSSFSCQSATTCWCAAFPPILSLSTDQDCLCPACLQNKMQEATEQYAKSVMAGECENKAPLYRTPPNQLKENIDYYIENGLFVFKEWYHLKRGTCCGNRCRHCPFAHVNV